MKTSFMLITFYFIGTLVGGVLFKKTDSILVISLVGGMVGVCAVLVSNFFLG